MSPRNLFPLFVLLGLGPALIAQGILLPNGTPDPSYPNLHAWYDAASGPNSSPTPLPNGTAMTRWDDLSAHGFHLTHINSSTTRLPTVMDDATSCGTAVRFDGNDYIWTAAGDPFGRIVGARTIFCVASTDAANRGYLFDGATNSGRTAIFAGQSSAPDDWQVYYSQLSPSGSNLIPGPPIHPWRYLCHSLVLDGGAQEYYLDGTLVASDTDPVAGDLGGFILGARVNTANGLQGYIREVLVYDAALNAADRQAVEGYLLNRHRRGYGEAYGAGCAGTGGLVPLLGTRGFPHAGCSFDVVLSDALPSTTCAFNFGAAQVSLPLGPCTWLTDPFVFSATLQSDGAGTAVLTIPVPAGIGPAMLTVQALVLDAGAAPFGISLSNGVQLNAL